MQSGPQQNRRPKSDSSWGHLLQVPSTWTRMSVPARSKKLPVLLRARLRPSLRRRLAKDHSDPRSRKLTLLVCC
ncbi:unnamed protein product [Symbiodinium sp. CCMP2456]|nr:unnamed protein product [Symbiodinium sp. CCMP2456]